MSGLSGSRKCKVVKKESEEFEFFLTSDEVRKGQIITSVTKGGPANRGGLKDGDRIIEINESNVEGKDHNQIVELIRQCIPKNEIAFVVVDKENDPNTPKTERPARQSSKVEPRPRLCKIKKKNNSFGFFLERDSKGDFIKNVTEGGASDGTGLKQGDRLIAVGKKNIEKMQHKQVVELIKASGTKVSLLVIDESGYDHCKTNNIPITEKMVRGSTSSRNSSSSSSKSVKKSSSTKVKQQSTKAKAKSNENAGKVRVVHMLKHPTNGYGFFLRAKSSSPGEYIGKIDAGSCAEIAGLFENDRVLAVNGKSIMDMNHADVISLVKTKQYQVVLVVLDEQAMKHFEEKDDYPSTADIVRSHNPAIRTVKLTKGDAGYGMFLKVEKGRSFHVLTDVTESGVAGSAGLKSGEIVLAVNGQGVLKDDHAACVKKIKDAGSSVELTVASLGTSEFVLKSNVEVTIDFIKEWPTEEELEVPSFGKVAKPVEKVVAKVVETETKQEGAKIEMKPRLCRVVRGEKGYGFVLKDSQNAHFLVNVEDGSPAYQAGVLEYDRIVEINGENVDKLKHPEVVGKIKGSGGEVTFLVVNKEEDAFFKEKGIPITAALLEVKDELSDEHRPRLCKLVKKSGGYGFHLAGESGRDGQFIKEVQAGSAAEEGGLRDGDKIVQVNGSSVEGEGHDAIVKRITENKNEVTFLVVDKEGEIYYRLKGIKILHTMVVAKEVVETKEELDEQQKEESKSIGGASAASSIVETEVTVHQEPEVDHDIAQAAAVAAVATVVASKVGDMRDDESQASHDDHAQSSEEPIRIVDEEEDERREEIVEAVVKTAAVVAAVDVIRDSDNESHREDEESVKEEEPAQAPALSETVSIRSEENVEEPEDKPEEEEREGISDAAKVAVATAAVVAVTRDEDTASEKSSRPASPVTYAEITETVQEIVQDRAEDDHDKEDTYEEIATTAAVIAGVVEDKVSERDESEEEKEDEEDLRAAAKAAAALVHKEIVDRAQENEDIKPEEPKQAEPEKPATPEPVIAPPQEPQAPPTPPASQAPPPASQAPPTPPPQERPQAVPLAVILTANGDIPKLKPTPPPPSNEPKIIWGQKNLKPITKQISVGTAASAVANGEAKKEPALAKFSTVAALKAKLEGRNREQQAASGYKNEAKSEIAELTKQTGGASKSIAAKFGGSVKRPEPGAPKKNPWVGEGMTIKIIET